MNDETNREDDGTADLDPDATATVATILAEVRDTAPPAASREHVAEMIRSRLDREGVALTGEEVDDLASQVVEGRD